MNRYSSFEDAMMPVGPVPAFQPKPPQKAKGLSVKWQVLIGFAVFTVVIVILLWVFQILLLNPFYESIITSEVKSSAETLRQLLDDKDALQETAEELLNKNFTIIISDEIGVTYLAYQPNYIKRSFLANNADRLFLIELFNEVNVGGGSQLYKLNTMQGHGGKSLIYAVTTKTPAGSYRLIVLETEITPVDSTVETLKVQLLWLTCVMVILGIFLAFYIARKISKPIESINESAKVLATGNYDITFRETGSREIKELAHTLNYASNELSKVEGLRRELLANVSHDLRTPLTMIKGYSEVMRDIPGENSPENVQILIDETTRLTDLVNDLLDLSKLESGVVPLDFSRFNLTESIRAILARYDKLADFNFIFNVEQDIWVKADELKISQVIYNLVNNAINYAGDDKTITLRQITYEDKVRIEVADTGEGIPGEKLKDIWDRYYKIDKEHKRAQVGTGLGLSIVKNILDMHNGVYGVTSTLGSGSTFWFELPVDTPKQPPES